MLVLGIESSCDETAAAVVRDGREILSSIISSQIELHRPWGGVVPELASREHLNKIDPIVNEALDAAGITLEDIDAVAVTQGPGLIGSLMVGVCYAKALAFARGIPFVGVNHIEGHVYSVNFENPPVEYPAVALIVSGGHTNIFHLPHEGEYRLMSRTRDDAAGEAFDKVAKMLGLGYPGGPVIERLAREGEASKAKFPRAKISDGSLDLSFSGLKTAVVRHVREQGIEPADDPANVSQEIKDVAAGFQKAVVGALIARLEQVSEHVSPRTMIVAGGVVCNTVLRDAATALGNKIGCPVYLPSKHLSTDNAAMIAAAGHFHLAGGRRDDLGLAADVTMRLQNAGDVRPAGKVRYRV
ncbi:MAG: tRNA (adenosine(37)-N6)-threonylcarbamoyltransferase complex transferase subunit TsaD [Acidobacteria bacterium]|nr:tRNA (adenosine(37)-N6)-threonylcarbamoyltransferase complex transferase subunit TsaD [Acidobacteriota bacterium]